MVIDKWEYRDIFQTSFWRDTLLSANKQKSIKNKSQSKSKISDHDIHNLWEVLADNIKGLYFHTDIRLFRYWLLKMNKRQIRSATQYIKSNESVLELENYIIETDSYSDMLEYASTLKQADEQECACRICNSDKPEELSFTSYIFQVASKDVLMYITPTQVMIGGKNKELVGDSYMKLLQSGYNFVYKIMIQPSLMMPMTTVYVFEYIPGSTPLYSCMN